MMPSFRETTTLDLKAYDPEELDELMKQSKEMTRKGIAKQMKVCSSSRESSVL